MHKSLLSSFLHCGSVINRHFLSTQLASWLYIPIQHLTLNVFIVQAQSEQWTETETVISLNFYNWNIFSDVLST